MTANKNYYTGKSALVTGAGSGIGAATAKAFAAAGSAVSCVDLNLAAAQATVATIESAGGRAIAIQADVASEADNQAMVERTCTELGGLDVAHLNAGILQQSSLLDIDVDTWDKVMAVNVRGVFLGLKAAVPVMQKAGGGAIAVTASIAGLRGDGAMSLYTTSKHAVIGLVKSAAGEFAASGVRVNAVAPGAVDTPMVSGNYEELGADSPLAQLHPLGRVGKPVDIANMVLFLCSDQASFVTGGVYPVDGGIMAVNNPRFQG
jgi:NAD(P)-dependent dehydrogenase (short-subunit alcohol dehydrogenase family)